MSEGEGRHVSGFVSILGRPNAGKSTLLNALVGMKLAIVADKPQTTRTMIQGVLTEPGCQIVFLDTPGIHRAGTSIQKRMMDTVHGALDQRDVLLFLVDASEHVSRADHHAVSLVRGSSAPVIAVFNKIDLLKDKTRLLPLIEEYQKLHPFAAFVPISAQKGQGLEDLKQEIVQRLPEGPLYFPEDHVTDQPERFLAAEGRTGTGESSAADARGGAAFGSGADRQVGRDADDHAHLRHNLCGARRTEAHFDRGERLVAEAHRYYSPRGDREDAWNTCVFELVCEGGSGLA
jgi:GTP-binding protein Era